jgi:hypothetical protein
VTAHLVAHEGERRGRRASSHGLFQLGWSEFWLLSGILGGMLALVALVFLVYLSSH